MKLFIIRYTKIIFAFLKLHLVFNLFSSLFLNLFYLTKFSLWISRNNKIAFNDFPSGWDYEKRYRLYSWVLEQEKLLSVPINYIEFGVATGQSFQWFMEQNKHSESNFYGFDTFTGLPEDWGTFKKGAFDNGNKVPDISDARGKFYQGLFQQTVPVFLQEFKKEKRNVIMLDADLYSATLYALASMAPFLKKGDIIFFDEFAVPTHEFKAFTDFTQSFYLELTLVGAANNYYFTAFKVG